MFGKLLFPTYSQFYQIQIIDLLIPFVLNSFLNSVINLPNFSLSICCISKFTSFFYFTHFKQLEINPSKNRTCSFPAYGSPLLLLNILVIYDFVTAPNINMNIRMNDSVFPYFIEPFQFETSSFTCRFSRSWNASWTKN